MAEETKPAKSAKSAPKRDPLIKTVSEVAAMTEAEQHEFRRKLGTTIEDAALDPAPAPAPAE